MISVFSFSTYIIIVLLFIPIESERTLYLRDKRKRRNATNESNLTVDENEHFQDMTHRVDAIAKDLGERIESGFGYGYEILGHSMSSYFSFCKITDCLSSLYLKSSSRFS